MKLWPFENAIILTAVLWGIWYFKMPLDYKTLGWVIGVMATHTAQSHAGRLREDAGGPAIDTSVLAGWLAALSISLASEATQSALLGLPLGFSVVHSFYRASYRAWRPVPGPKLQPLTRSARRTF